jgi:hypothetical protein
MYDDSLVLWLDTDNLSGMESDEVLIEFGGDIGAPYGRDQYTRLGHISLLDMDSVDWGLNINGASWTASSVYPQPSNSASNIGVATSTTTEDNTKYLHYNSTGYKWCKCTIPNAIIRKIVFQTGCGDSPYNQNDFPQNTRVTMKKDGIIHTQFYYTFPHPTGSPAYGEAMTPIERTVYVPDKSRYGNHGKISNTTICNGMNGKTLSLNGSSSYIDCGNNSTVNITGDYTIEAWIYITGNTPITELVMDSGNKGSSVYVFSNLTNDKPWPKGDYKVEIYIEDKKTPDAAVNFKVTD